MFIYMVRLGATCLGRLTWQSFNFLARNQRKKKSRKQPKVCRLFLNLCWSTVKGEMRPAKHVYNLPSRRRRNITVNAKKYSRGLNSMWRNTDWRKGTKSDLPDRLRTVETIIFLVKPDWLLLFVLEGKFFVVCEFYLAACVVDMFIIAYLVLISYFPWCPKMFYQFK